MAAKNKPVMETYDPESWTPRELVAPNGKTWTPSSLAEEKNLMAAHGYAVKSEGSGRKASANTPTTNEGTK